jgi:hypothetical protein
MFIVEKVTSSDSSLPLSAAKHHTQIADANRERAEVLALRTFSLIKSLKLGRDILPRLIKTQHCCRPPSRDMRTIASRVLTVKCICMP